MTKPSLIARCTLAEQCLPDAPYRAMLCKLHKDMLDEIDRLKAAQPAPTVQEPEAHLWKCLGRWSAYLVANGDQADCAPPLWLVDAVKQALAQPAPVQPVQDVDWKDMYEKEKRRSEMWVAKYEKDIGPLEYAMPVAETVQTVQEPACCVADLDRLQREMLLKEGHSLSDPLYTTPPTAQRQWVGLTDEEFIDLCEEASNFGTGGLIRHIEAKLKEKNNG
jgi:hypothetical protein